MKNYYRRTDLLLTAAVLLLVLSLACCSTINKALCAVGAGQVASETCAPTPLATATAVP